MINSVIRYKAIVTLATLNFLYYFAIYVTLPILALYFNQNFEISISMVGVVLALPPLIAALTGPVGAIVSRRIGEFYCLIIGVITMAACYTFYVFATSFWTLIIISIITGVSRVLWQPIIKALFAHHATKIENQSVVFRVNYIVICLGAITGPSVALLISGWSRHFNLFLSTFLFLSIIIILLATKSLLKVEDIENTSESKKRPSLSELKKAESQLFFYIIAGALVYLVFSQFETVFSLALKEVSRNPEVLFSILLIVNALTGVLLQVSVMVYLKKLSNSVAVQIGNLSFALSFCVFAFSNGSIPLLVLATIIFTVGEVLSIPGSDIAINELASAKNKTLYFSLAEFRIIGFSLGPIISAFLLDYYGSFVMYLSSVGIILVASLLYVVQKMKMSRKTPEKGTPSQI